MMEGYSNRDFLKDLWLLLGTHKLAYSFWYSVRLIASVLRLVMPFAIAKLIDFFTTYHRGDSLYTFYYWLVVILVTSLLDTVMRLLAKFYLGDLGRKIQVETRLQALSSLLNYSLSWHEQEGSGNKVQRIQNGTEGIHLLSQFIRRHSTDIFAGITGITVVFTYLSLKYTIILILYAALYLGYEAYQNKKIARRVESVQSYSEQVSGKVYEYTANISTVKSLGMAAPLKRRARHFEQKLGLLKRAEYVITTQKWAGIQIISNIFLAIFLAVVGFDILQGMITVGMLALFIGYVDSVHKSLNELSEHLESLIHSKQAIAMMMPFLRFSGEKDGGQLLPRNWKTITFSSVSFAYKKRPVLQNFSLVIRRGEKIGFVGMSGEGKTTVLKLLLKMYSPNQGRIMVDGVSLQDISQRSISKAISIVPQDVDLFNLPLKENITLAAGKISLGKLQQALDISSLGSVVKKLPQGLLTVVGERGFRLSGGERQRVGIARAVYADTDVLLLDEATSHLDSATEQNIYEGIEKLKGKTVIAVAHRLSTLRDMDRIITMKDGRIIEDGSFSGLLKRKGEFYRLYRLQQRMD